ncbi:NADP-dependent oxidoreductase [Kribbella sp. NPDC005582]|uniref:NADP-dependent oxidoreductase n=1 Tax=Kribbella sp. NPDC005582 TaxID=3156893 RepID=UPI0033A6E9BF
MTTMRTMATDRVGPEAELRPHDLPVKEPADGEVLIKVMAAAVNPADLGMLAGNYRWYDDLRLPLVPGYDVAGVVEGGAWETGAAVIASTGHSHTQVGGYAEYVTLPATQVATAPTNLDWAEAATLPLAGLTAYQALDVLDLAPGSSLVINGARGAVGRFAAELAASRGLTVRTLSRGETSPAASADAALDVVGGPAARAAFAAVRDGGSYVTTVPEFWVPGGQFTPARGIEPRLFRAEPDGRILDHLARDAEAGHLTATVAKTFPLTEAPTALDLLTKGGLNGKLVLIP